MIQPFRLLGKAVPEAQRLICQVLLVADQNTALRSGLIVPHLPMAVVLLQFGYLRSLLKIAGLRQYLGRALVLFGIFMTFQVDLSRGDRGLVLIQRDALPWLLRNASDARLVTGSFLCFGVVYGIASPWCFQGCMCFWVSCFRLLPNSF